MAIRTKHYAFAGGLDTVTPPINISPGKCISMQNFEPWYHGGYRRIAGYERFDGRTAPSAATFTGFDLADTTGLSLGDVLTGDTSSASGTVIGISGNSVGVTKVSGTFTQSEAFNTAAYTMATTPAASIGRSPTTAVKLTFQLAAADEYRNDITVPAGSGEIRGIWQLKDKKFCIRNNAGGTAGVMFVASASGWTTTGLTMASYIFFDAGQAAGPFVVGTTVTGLASSATAVVHRVVLQSGAWDGSATGYLALTTVSGTFQDNEALRVGGVTFATSASVATAFTFAAGGHYQFINHNFFGSSATYRAYGCNGVGPGFEIDENEIVTPILMPQTALGGQPATNIPKFIAEHRNYLFYGFPGGSLQHSVIGEPLTFNGFLGAAEFGIGDEITGLQSMAGAVLNITSTRETRGLFGKTTSDWEMKLLGEETGGKAYTVEKLDTVYSIDDLGITNLSRTDSFGDFVGATVSQLVQDVVNAKKSLATTATVNRASNQYRVYFSDGTALVLYSPAGSFNAAQSRSKLPVVHFGSLKYPAAVNRIFNTDDENGAEVTYFATSDGYVYKDQVGGDFDGAEITSFCRLHFNNVGSPGTRKRYRKADIELDSTVNIDLKFLADLSYASTDTNSVIEDLTVSGGGGFWNSATWDEFQWNSQSQSSASAKLTGTGDNIGFLIYNKSAKAQPFVLQGLTLYYEPRRLKR